MMRTHSTCDTWTQTDSFQRVKQLIGVSLYSEELLLCSAPDIIRRLSALCHCCGDVTSSSACFTSGSCVKWLMLPEVICSGVFTSLKGGDEAIHTFSVPATIPYLDQLFLLVQCHCAFYFYHHILTVLLYHWEGTFLKGSCGALRDHSSSIFYLFWGVKLIFFNIKSKCHCVDELSWQIPGEFQLLTTSSELHRLHQTSDTSSRSRSLTYADMIHAAKVTRLGSVCIRRISALKNPLTCMFHSQWLFPSDGRIKRNPAANKRPWSSFTCLMTDSTHTEKMETMSPMDNTDNTPI